ncbi:hypothetical protein [Natranaerobius thermophilus]|uniref:Uncharacterized protein n=1 Tax=Natranaerobius thermophilus (strain ATCC BAA-1301 / DSM 18059 / JW/NM-WN-LF) TaxID=457570 RepID=B2A8B3_NATTJ|nr:hypothetical protein [Natranaerobius thermophilus]ACB84479.1 hypothetical protein Nther_0894 [Natranaerobius thermophilus JW/NM-WN-LF]
MVYSKIILIVLTSLFTLLIHFNLIFYEENCEIKVGNNQFTGFQVCWSCILEICYSTGPDLFIQNDKLVKKTSYVPVQEINNRVDCLKISCDKDNNKLFLQVKGQNEKQIDLNELSVPHFIKDEQLIISVYELTELLRENMFCFEENMFRSNNIRVARSDELIPEIGLAPDNDYDKANENKIDVNKIEKTQNFIIENTKLECSDFTITLLKDGELGNYSGIVRKGNAYHIYLDTSHKPERQVGVLLHEIGHIIDYRFMNDEKRAEYLELRNCENIYKKIRFWNDSEQKSWYWRPAEFFAEDFRRIYTQKLISETDIEVETYGNRTILPGKSEREKQEITQFFKTVTSN